jgi:hypothetical protein
MAVTARLRRRPDLQVRPDPVPIGGDGVITSLTTVTPLRPDVDPDDVRTMLSRLPVGAHSPFAVSTRTHFARIQVLDEFMTDERRPLAAPVLVLSADVDGEPRSYLLEVLGASRDALAPILARCAGAPIDLTDGFASAATDYLLDHRLPVGLQYANSPGRSVLDVRWAVDRHRRLAGFALAHQHDSPSSRRQAFLRTFGPRPGVTS